MTNLEKNLIRCIVNQDYKSALTQVKYSLGQATQQKDREFVADMLKKLEPTSAFQDLPSDLQSFFRVERPENFVEDKYLLRQSEAVLVEKMRNLHKAADKLDEMRVPYNPALLLHGDSGCGKTELAWYIAHKVDLPLAIVRFPSLVSSYLGKTPSNVAKVFNYVRAHPCVLCFDEIDAVGVDRSRGNNIEEMNRVTIAIMQELDRPLTGSIIIGTTNRFELLDPALTRRFPVRYTVEPLQGDESKQLARKFFGFVGLNTDSWFDAWCRKEFGWKTPASQVIWSCTQVAVQNIVFGDKAEYLSLTEATPEEAKQAPLPAAGRDEYPNNLAAEIAYDLEITTPDQVAGLEFALKRLTEREQAVLKYRYAEGKTLTETGKLLQVTRERIRQIEVRALRMLRRPDNLRYIQMGFSAVQAEKEAAELAAQEDAKRREWEAEQKKAQLQLIGKTIIEKRRLKGKVSPEEAAAIAAAGEALIDELDLSVRSWRYLKAKGIITITDALQLSDEELMNIRNMGLKSGKEVSDHLDRFVLQHKSDPTK